MKISEQWLREWVNPPGDVQQLAEQLTMAGLEVDGVEPAAPSLDGVVVGKVLEKEQHPNADRLSLCQVDVGSGEALKIVCGASNVYAGGVFPVATIGTRLPGDLKIKKGKLRGEASHGMLCSGVELGIAESAEGLLELPADLEPGTPVVEALKLDDQIIEVDLTPNRADCFSMLGVARDIAAFNDLPFAEPEVAAVEPVSEDTLAINIAAQDGCPAFAGRVVRNINTDAETPLWMTERLRRAGVRPLHPVVDVTNYVMLEFGQPMHAYDLNKLQGAVSARLAKQSEKITLLDGQEVELSDDVMVIADGSGAIAMAGIMGGDSTAVSAATTDIFFESAFFAPQVMAGRARRYGMHTDASLRFERGVDFAQQVRAIEKATSLLLAIAGGQPGPVVDQRDDKELPARKAVSLRRDRLARLLGIDVPDADVQAMFERLGFAVQADDTGWRVTPTSVRFDIEIEADLIEEVARLYGYDKVPDIRSSSDALLGRRTESSVPVSRAAALLANRGYTEAITYSFVDPELQQLLLGMAEELPLANPISVEQSVMRRSLWPGLLSAAEANRKRQQERVNLFETGLIFSAQSNEVKEINVIGGVAWGRVLAEHWDDDKAADRAVDFFDVKADVEALLGLAASAEKLSYVTSEHATLRPGRTAQIEKNGVAVGWLGELHPRLVRKLGLGTAPILFELQMEATLAAEVPEYRSVSRFPAVRRDLAVMVSEDIAAAEIVCAVEEAAGALLQEVKVFDVYRGDSIEKGLKSVALGLILQETSRTLTEPEIDGVISSVIEGLSSKLNASIRE